MAVPELTWIIERILALRPRDARYRCPLVGISGIDASGKGYVTRKLDETLASHGRRVAVLNVDGWLNLPNRRFGLHDPSSHFYRHALRLDEMFANLILPLRQQGTVRLTMDFAEETAMAFRPEIVEFESVDIVLVEGIFLFKRAYRDHFDLRIWIECPFSTALGRAIARGQEGLPPEETIRAYETFYFPAQRLHFELDGPQAAADAVIENSEYLSDQTNFANGMRR